MNSDVPLILLPTGKKNNTKKIKDSSVEFSEGLVAKDAQAGRVSGVVPPY